MAEEEEESTRSQRRKDITDTRNTQVANHTRFDDDSRVHGRHQVDGLNYDAEIKEPKEKTGSNYEGLKSIDISSLYESPLELPS